MGLGRELRACQEDDMTARAPKKRIPKDPHAEAVRVLSAQDPKLGAYIARIGPCGLPGRGHKDASAYFRSLVKAIVSQQLSGKAAATIFGRVEALAPHMTPEEILSISVEDLRGAGLSGMKTAFVRDLAERVKSGSLDLVALDDAEDEVAIEILSSVKGIGRWTAQMFLMFHLGRPDVFAPDDLGLRKGIMRLVKARKEIDRKRLERIASAWKPHRSVASWYLWRITEIVDE